MNCDQIPSFRKQKDKKRETSYIMLKTIPYLSMKQD